MPDNEDATAALYDALEQHGPDPAHGFDRDSDFVDLAGSEVAAALLAAGWTPPSRDRDRPTL